MKSFIKELMKKGAQKLAGQGKTTGTEVIKNVNIAKDLTTKRNIQDKVTEAVDSAFKKANAPPSIANQQKKSKLKRDEGKKLKDFSYRLDKLQEKIDKRNKASKKLFKFNKGGRVGLKFGSKKSNVQKIQEALGPKKKLSAKQMKIAKLAGNPKKIDAQDLAKLRGRG